MIELVNYLVSFKLYSSGKIAATLSIHVMSRSWFSTSTLKKKTQVIWSFSRHLRHFLDHLRRWGGHWPHLWSSSAYSAAPTASPRPRNPRKRLTTTTTRRPRCWGSPEASRWRSPFTPSTLASWRTGPTPTPLEHSWPALIFRNPRRWGSCRCRGCQRWSGCPSFTAQMATEQSH